MKITTNDVSSELFAVLCKRLRHIEGAGDVHVDPYGYEEFVGHDLARRTYYACTGRQWVSVHARPEGFPADDGVALLLQGLDAPDWIECEGVRLG